MTALKKEAVQMIESMGDEEVVQVIAFLKDIRLSKAVNGNTKDENAMRGLETLKSFAGILPEGFDYEKELAEAREEKYGRVD